MYIAVAAAVGINLAVLLAYQHYLAADFPFQDEIGYVSRLHQLPQTGLFHYLFDRYWSYYIPTQLFIWYEFYARTHLNIMDMRYTGAAISALVSLLLCAMLYRKAASLNWLTLLAILCGPFIICSYNNWASYNQSIEAVVEPLLFGAVLVLTLIAEKGQRVFEERAPGKTFAWIGLFVVVWLLATGIGAPPLVLPAAFVGARILLERRIDLSLILLAIVAVLVPAWYVISGDSFNQGFSAAHSTFGLHELRNALEAVVGLVGNGLYSPLNPGREKVTLLLGASVIAAQIVATIYAMRLPPAQRSRFLVPLTLTLYTFLVLVEIIVGRMHEPGLAFTPRYAMFALGAPVSLLFWFVAMADSFRWKAVFGVATIVVVASGVALADDQTAHQLPYVRVAFARARAAQISLQADPTPLQQAEMFVNPPLLPLVYPDVQFMRREHLAEFEGQQTAEDAAEQEAAAPTQQPTAAAPQGALTIVGYGPAHIQAGTPFNVQLDGSSAIWIETNPTTVGQVFIVINGTRLATHHRDNVVAATVPAFLYVKPGTYKMYVLETTQEHSIKSEPVDFIVH